MWTVKKPVQYCLLHTVVIYMIWRFFNTVFEWFFFRGIRTVYSGQDNSWWSCGKRSKMDGCLKRGPTRGKIIREVKLKRKIAKLICGTRLYFLRVSAVQDKAEKRSSDIIYISLEHSVFLSFLVSTYVCSRTSLLAFTGGKSIFLATRPPERRFVAVVVVVVFAFFAWT